MRKSAVVLFALAVALFFVSANSAFGQATNAQLNGTVTDQSGGSVAGAMVTVRNTATNTSYATTSNASGYYVVANLPPGNYELTASFTGFANYRQTGIVIEVGQVATLNIGLQIASAGEKVVVTTEVPVIEPTKTEISQVVATQQIESLPISNRVFTDFALLTPGVATSRTSLGTTFTEFEVTQISFGGMRSFSNEITVDGADFVNSASGIQRSTPPQESVQEFRVVNNSFGAESGRAVGGIVNIVTKSGTNDLHGSLYEYFQNASLDSRSLLQPAPLPKQRRQNQFGASIGGPIVKDKTFFFMNYEGKRSAQSPIYPPDLVNNILLIDQAKALMGLAPEGCAASLAKCLPNFAGNPANITQAQAVAPLRTFLKTGDDDFGFARLDHQLTTNNRLALRYNVEDVRSLGELVGSTLDGGGIGTPSGGRTLLVRDQAVVATVNSILTPSVVNTVLVQYARRHYNFGGATGQPDLTISNDLELGHNFGTNDRLYETRAQLGDSVSWVKGNHLWKFGGEGNWLTSLEQFPGFTPEDPRFPGIPCLADFAEYFNTNFGAKDPTAGTGLDASAAQCVLPQFHGVAIVFAGVPLPTAPTACGAAGPCAPTVTAANAAALGVGPANGWSNAYPQSFFSRYQKVIDHGYWSGFVQDQWRITPKFTLNYGLRWDVESGLKQFVTQDWNGWQPRIGLAYSPDNKTVVRAGFGLFFDRQNLTFFFVPNTQKVVAGYQCANNPPANIKAACAAANTLPQQFPNLLGNNGQDTQGYQIFAFPGAAGGDVHAAQILATGGYDQAFPAISMAGTCASTFACGVGMGGMDHNARTPYAEQASFELDRQFGGGFALNLGYLFVGAHKLVRGNNINVPCPVGTTDAAQAANPTDPNLWPLAPAFLGFKDWVPGMVNPNGTFSKCATGTPTLATGALAGLGPWFQGAGPASGLQTMSSGLEDFNNDVSNAIYHGATATVIERIKNFNLTGNYTYSHGIDNGNFTTFINLPVNQLNYRAERGNSNQDVRHRFVANFTATGPEDTWVRHFTLSSIVTLQAGRPFTIFYGAPSLNDNVAGPQTDRVGGAPLKTCTSNCGPGYQSVCTTASNCATMIGRNTYIGDPLYSWDFHLGRYFQLTERMKMDLSVDAFNLLNRSNVDEINFVYGSPVFCGGVNGASPVIPRHYRDGITRAIQAGPAGITCPNGIAGETPVFAGPVQVGNNAATPVNTFPPGLGPLFVPLTIFVPDNPSPNFGRPRTMLNPRQFQFAARFTF